MYQKQSEESRDERQITLEPGQEICQCGAIVEPDERRKCVECGHDGCIHCLHLIDTTGAEDLNDDWACSAECELDWLEGLSRSSRNMYVDYQAWILPKIAAARKKVAR